MAKLEDYRERDKIRDAELALVKEKLAIVISSFETEKAKIIAEYTLNFHENKTKLAISGRTQNSKFRTKRASKKQR